MTQVLAFYLSIRELTSTESQSQLPVLMIDGDSVASSTLTGQPHKQFVLDATRTYEGPPSAARSDPEGGPLVSCAYGQQFQIDVYPGGIKKESAWKVTGKGGNIGKRGKINGLSKHAAGRLREFLVTHYVPGREPYAATLTARKLMSPDEWRIRWKRFRTRAAICLTAAVYRVELQRRGAPHIHSLVWVENWESGEDPGRERQEKRWEQMDLWGKGWLDCITDKQPDGKRIYDGAEFRYATRMRRVEDEGWALYTALHSGKAKKAQLGWIGKQWGIIGKHLFKRRKPVQLQLYGRQRWVFQRLMRRLLRLRGATKCKLPSYGAWLRCMDSKVALKLLAWAKAQGVE